MALPADPRSSPEEADRLAEAWFVRGQRLEQDRRFDEAFAAFETGNLLARPRRDPASFASKHALMLDHMRAVFTPSLFALAGEGCPEAAPIFIVGMPRSGSTLIEQILASHPRVQSLGEFDAFDPLCRAEYPYDLSAPIRFSGVGRDYLKAARTAGWRGWTRLVDKSLFNYLRVGMIHLVFPRAVILHAVRDPADTCFSAYRLLFYVGNDASFDLGDLGRHYLAYRQVMDHWQRLMPGRVVDVIYEDLVAEPERVIRGLVTDTCGLPWNGACLRFYDTKRPVFTASVNQVRRPINSEGVGRWRNFRTHLAPLFEALGPYAPADA